MYVFDFLSQDVTDINWTAASLSEIPGHNYAYTNFHCQGRVLFYLAWWMSTMFTISSDRKL